MGYVKVETGNTMTSAEMNANFQWIGQGDKIPMGGQDLAHTNGAYDLGSDVYRWNKLYCNDIPSVTSINTVWQRIATVNITATTSAISFTGLNGDTDIEYRLIYRTLSQFTGTTIFTYYLYFNIGLGSYGSQFFLSELGGTTARRTSGSDALFLGSAKGSAAGTAGTQIIFGETLIYAKTGYERIISSRISTKNELTTVGRIYKLGGLWGDTTDTITAIHMARVAPGAYEPGSFAELYKRR